MRSRRVERQGTCVTQHVASQTHNFVMACSERLPGCCRNRADSGVVSSHIVQRRNSLPNELLRSVQSMRHHVSVTTLVVGADDESGAREVVCMGVFVFCLFCFVLFYLRAASRLNWVTVMSPDDKAFSALDPAHHNHDCCSCPAGVTPPKWLGSRPVAAFIAAATIARVGSRRSIVVPGVGDGIAGV